MASKKEKNNGGELAVILTGGKQYVVSPGDIINIEKIPAQCNDFLEIVELWNECTRLY